MESIFCALYTPSLSGMLNVTHEVLKCLCQNKQLLRLTSRDVLYDVCSVVDSFNRGKNAELIDVISAVCCDEMMSLQSFIRLFVEKCHRVETYV